MIIQTATPNADGFNVNETLAHLLTQIFRLMIKIIVLRINYQQFIEL